MIKKIKLITFIFILVGAFYFRTNDVYAKMELNNNLNVINGSCDIFNNCKGSIVKFKVSESSTKEFYIISDSGSELVLMLREKYVDENGSVNKSFYRTRAFIDSTLTYVTSNWKNAINIKEKYNNKNYDIKLTSNYGRLATFEEVTGVGNTTVFGGSSDGKYEPIINTTNHNYAYWIMSKSDGSEGLDNGNPINAIVRSTGHAALTADVEGILVPVIEVEKYQKDKPYNDNTNNTDNNKNEVDKIPDSGMVDENGNKVDKEDVKINSDGQIVTNDGKPVYDKDGNLLYLKGQKVEVDDTMKTIYIAYIIGTVILLLGIFLIYKTIRKNVMEQED